MSEILKDHNVTEEYKKEMLDKFQLKTKTLYNAKIDEDNIDAFISKDFGQKNLASYISFYCPDENIDFGEDLVFLNGKLEFENGYLTFLTKIAIIYGTYSQDSCYPEYTIYDNKNGKKMCLFYYL